MPIIKPPSDEPSNPQEEKISISDEKRKFIEDFLNVEHWKCPKCGITNFGRNKHCARWTCKEPKP